jgi:hypothetical protein
MTIGVHAQNSLLVCTHIESVEIEGVVEDSVAIYKANTIDAVVGYTYYGNLKIKGNIISKPMHNIKSTRQNISVL